MIRKLILALTATGIVLGASACNTVKGLGNDIESVGEAGDRALRK
jgi:entericidin B